MTRFHPDRRKLILAGAATLLLGAAESTEPQWALVDEAIATLRSHAYYSARVDWDAASARTKRMRDEGATPQDAIRFAVAQLRDGHSFYISSVSADRLQSNQATDDFGTADAMRGRFGYLLVPNFVGNAETRTAAFANDLRRRLARLEQGRPCGWIVDLRKNGGGNMLPMLSGLRPLLGDEDLGSFVGREGKTPWRADRLEATLAPGAIETVRVREGSPVAVLAGPGTASSGEIVLASFIGRPRTRIFGDATAGKTSGNRGFRLADGSMLLVATALIADRNGKVYEGRIEPDEAMWSDGDAVVERASSWLATQCPEDRK